MTQDATPLTGRTAVPWERLRHHDGPAGDVPGLLTACSAPDAEQACRAFEDLAHKIYHQGGTVLSAAPPLLGILLDRAGDPGFAPRLDAIGLVGRLARAARQASPELVTPDWAPAWRAAVAPLLELLADPDPAVRRAVALPLEQAVAEADVVLPALLARWRAEPAEPVRLRLVQAAGQLLRHTPAQWPPEVIDWLGGLPRHPDPAQRFAGVLALRRCGLGGRDPRHVDEAVAYLGSAQREVPRHDAQDAQDAQATQDAEEPWQSIRRAGALLDEDRDGRVRLVSALLVQERDALQAAAEVLSRWRSPLATLLPLVARRLSDPCPENRRFAAALLASAGDRALPWADELAAACADEAPKVAPAALHALVRIGDPRAAAVVAERLGRDAHRLAARTEHGHWWYRPSLADVLDPLHPFADDLLPVVRARLRASRSPYERPALLRVLAGWGPVARPAVAELVEQLGTDAEAQALDALIALDTAEARAAARPGTLAAVRRGDAGAAHRLWLLTGDPADAPDDPRVAAGLGPAAAHLEPGLRARVTEGGEGWRQVEAAYALWRISGDPADAERTALAARRTLVGRGSGHRLGGLAIRILQPLAGLGPAAALLVPALHPLLSADRRPVASDGWSSMPDDDALCAAARGILAADGM
uniref:HEAT repeat domain-containing protein n=1 Tax=Streptomyces sp. NBC_00049 TaxID=2903617 RepID=A0AAU2JW45_9ACTN